MFNIIINVEVEFHKKKERIETLKNISFYLTFYFISIINEKSFFERLIISSSSLK